MQSSKPSKKSNKTDLISSAPQGEPTVIESKPAKRSTKAPAAAAPSTPKTTTHKHSKVSVPVTASVEEVIAEVVVSPVTTMSPIAPINHDEVARLAYSFWEQRKPEHGSPEEDWHRAVKSLSAKA